MEIKDIKPNAELIQAVKTVLLAMAYTETVRQTVHAYQVKHLYILMAKDDEGNYITNPKRAFRMNDEDHTLYVQSCHEEAIKAGYNVEFGYCPLLIAEDIERKAKREMVDATKYFTGITSDQILNHSFDKYLKFVDCTIGFVTGHPLFKNVWI